MAPRPDPPPAPDRRTARQLRRASRRAVATRPPLTERIAGFIDGPRPALPRPLDAVARAWAGFAPRVRALGIVGAIALSIIACEQRAAGVAHQYGGPPVPVVVATAPLGVGDPAEELRLTHVPADMVPDGALTTLPTEAVAVAIAVPPGAVVTEAHLDPRGPAASLAAGLRAVPVEVDPDWGVVTGGFVDVWILGAGDQPATVVARGRPVLSVSGGTSRSTALLGLAADEVATLSEGMSLGRVLLVHAPP